MRKPIIKVYRVISKYKPLGCIDCPLSRIEPTRELGAYTAECLAIGKRGVFNWHGGTLTGCPIDFHKNLRTRNKRGISKIMVNELPPNCNDCIFSRLIYPRSGVALKCFATGRIKAVSHNTVVRFRGCPLSVIKGF